VIFKHSQEDHETLQRDMKKRLDVELDIIKKMGYAGYFLIVWDFINYAKMPTFGRPGRGSAAGSLVAYSMRITDIDPIQYKPSV
jgi:DNA polymerase-3 subunit alpha